MKKVIVRILIIILIIILIFFVNIFLFEYKNYKEKQSNKNFITDRIYYGIISNSYKGKPFRKKDNYAICVDVNKTLGLDLTEKLKDVFFEVRHDSDFYGIHFYEDKIVCFSPDDTEAKINRFLDKFSNKLVDRYRLVELRRSNDLTFYYK